MADTGKPLPVAIRLEIKDRRSHGETVRHVAGTLKISTATVQKYCGKLDTRLLNREKESA